MKLHCGLKLELELGLELELVLALKYGDEVAGMHGFRIESNGSVGGLIVVRTRGDGGGMLGIFEHFVLCIFCAF